MGERFDAGCRPEESVAQRRMTLLIGESPAHPTFPGVCLWVLLTHSFQLPRGGISHGGLLHVVYCVHVMRASHV